MEKLLKTRFIYEVRYPKWLTNIVPVQEKNGQIKVCINYKDLNSACSTDNFSLPLTELLVDATMGYEALSFMDGYSRYNQIQMALEDEEATTFHTPIRIFYYKVMPFDLKNADATYQREMTYIFEDLLHDVIEYYIDDLVIKIKLRQHHY